MAAIWRRCRKTGVQQFPPEKAGPRAGLFFCGESHGPLPCDKPHPPPLRAPCPLEMHALDHRLAALLHKTVLEGHQPADPRTTPPVTGTVLPESFTPAPFCGIPRHHSLPRNAAVICPNIDSAISAGPCAPMLRPTGP